MDQHSVFFQAMIYLAAAVVMVPFAKRLGLGSVLGYLLAGVVIGPAVLGFIGEEGQDIMHFSEFGVVMMLFVIGLELEPDRLWKLRKPIVGLGGLQVVLSSAILAGIGMAMNMDWKSALALGMTLSLSSTAIVLQTLTEKGLMKSVAGQSAFSVLLFQDIAVIPMLALFPLPASGQAGAAHGTGGNTLVSGLPAWGQTLATLASVAFIIVGGRYLINPLFRIIASTRLREIFTATSLLLVVGIAVLMTQVGLSPALGTFLAGVVLANSEYKHELESDIEPFKGLLLGLFFIAVGASIDFKLIAAQPLVVAGLVAVLMLVKGGVLFGLGKVFKISKNQNMLFAVALCQVGEFAFVLLSFSNQAGIIPRNIIDLMIAVVAITMALTPVAMLVNEKFFIARDEDSDSKEDLEPDDIDEINPVIIAGFGEFGNTVGRFLRANNIGTTILDIDTDRVDTLRKLGFKVYYGDASRHDLLHSAGASEAKLIVIAIDNAEKRLEMITTVKKHFPNLRMLVRSTNRMDAYDQMNEGMLHVYRQSVDTALRLGVDAMKFLGFRTYTAQRAAHTFLKHDERSLKKLASIREDDQYIVTAREMIEELEMIIKTDKETGMLSQDSGWDEDTLIEEAASVPRNP